LLERFSPVIGLSRTGEKSVRFGLGAYDFPGSPFARWAVLRGLVFALQTEAESAWNEAVSLAEELIEWNRAHQDPLDEPGRTRDPALLKRADDLLQDPIPSAKAQGLKLHAKALLSVGEVEDSLAEWYGQALNHWRVRWNLADDCSAFTLAVFMAAVNATDAGQQLPAYFHAARDFLFLMQSDWGIDPVAFAAPGPPPGAHATREVEALSRYLETLNFEFPGFTPLFEDEATYRTAAREEFERELNWHIAAHNAVLDAGGAPRTPIKRVPDHHFRWYIRYQVLGQTLEEIAKACCATRGAISLALKDVHELAGVPLREPKRGRPRKGKIKSTLELSS
jgi:hypothetical protein